jgi:hypothetical protein
MEKTNVRIVMLMKDGGKDGKRGEDGGYIPSCMKLLPFIWCLHSQRANRHMIDSSLPSPQSIAGMAATTTATAMAREPTREHTWLHCIPTILVRLKMKKPHVEYA